MVHSPIEFVSASDSLTAFVEESGDSGLSTEKHKTSNLFVVVAVICTSSMRQALEDGARAIAKDYFSGSEIKSSKVGTNHQRRIAILDRISQLSFLYRALIVDKQQIRRDSGLQYKRSYLKYFHGELYDELRAGFRPMEVFVDRIGGPDFQESFEDYMNRKARPDLFSIADCVMVDSKATPGVQIADFVAGTLSYIYDPAKASDHIDDFRARLKPNEQSLRAWPVKWQRADNRLERDHELDETVTRMTSAQVEQFVDTYEDAPEEDRRIQVAVLRRLQFQQLFEGIDEPVFADDFIDRLNQQGFEVKNSRDFRRRVIGPIRDAGVVIVGGRKGYRLATSVEHLEEHTKHFSSILEPMIARLRKARDLVRFATDDKLDIVSLTESDKLSLVLDAFGEVKIEIGESDEA